MPNIPMVFIWLVLAIIFFVAEFATTGIVSIWFALGSLAALIPAWLMPEALWLQLTVFIAVTAVTLCFTRPVLSKYILRKTPTNADMLIGKTAVVIKDITPDGAGRAKVGDLTWMAKSTAELKEGETCIITGIEGASLIVEKAETTV